MIPNQREHEISGMGQTIIYISYYFTISSLVQFLLFSLNANPILSLRLTKFLVEISQFEFLFTTEKNIYVYKLLFVIKYLRFYNPSFQATLFENLVGGSTPSQQKRGEGQHYGSYRRRVISNKQSTKSYIIPQQILTS